MKYQTLLSGKNTGKILSLLSDEFAEQVPKVSFESMTDEHFFFIDLICIAILTGYHIYSKEIRYLNRFR